jgi:uncharacterized membrane protein YccF (DUF307 family)
MESQVWQVYFIFYVVVGFKVETSAISMELEGNPFTVERTKVMSVTCSLVGDLVKVNVLNYNGF